MIQSHHKWLIFAVVGMVVLMAVFGAMGANLSLSNSGSCPATSPVPNSTVKPTVKPTAKPTAKPSGSPTATPKPTASPKPTVTPTPTPVPKAHYTILYFCQPNCPYCEQQRPAMDAWAAAHSDRVTYRVIDLYQDSSTPAKYAIRTTPTTVMVDSTGKELTRWTGVFDTNDITVWLNAH